MSDSYRSSRSSPREFRYLFNKQYAFVFLYLTAESLSVSGGCVFVSLTRFTVIEKHTLVSSDKSKITVNKCMEIKKKVGN